MAIINLFIPQMFLLCIYLSIKIVDFEIWTFFGKSVAGEHFCHSDGIASVLGQADAHQIYINIWTQIRKYWFYFKWDGKQDIKWKFIRNEMEK